MRNQGLPHPHPLRDRRQGRRLWQRHCRRPPPPRDDLQAVLRRQSEDRLQPRLALQVHRGVQRQEVLSQRRFHDRAYKH